MREFCRCILCGGVVSEWDEAKGGCPKCGGVRIKPTYLGLWEEIVQICKHPVLLKDVGENIKYLWDRYVIRTR